MDQIFKFSRHVLAARCLQGVLAVLTCVTFAAPLRADPVDELLEALQIEPMINVMRTEGLAYGEDLGKDMLPGGGSEIWSDLVSEIYQAERMRSVVQAGISKVLKDADTDPLTAFFSSDLGHRIVLLELAAREAMIDEAVETAARDTFNDLDGSDDTRLAQIQRFVEVNDLLEANIAGALNASFQFYAGLVDGGGLRMSEAEILSDVWAQEEATRKDTREWLYSFLLLAYQPLEDDELETYIALSESPEGRALNRALFSGFNAMYDKISYALGLAAAQQMQQQDL